MSTYTRKLVYAAALSLSGIAATFGWYNYDLARSQRSDNSQKTLLGQIASAKNEVQKRQKGRVIWKRVEEQEQLFAGEAVRTSSDSEAKIKFNSGAEVDLDPDSVVTIANEGDKPNLDFVQGNIFVKGGAEADSLALKSGETKIDIKNANVSLGSSGGKTAVQVLSGTALVTNGDKKITLDQTHSGDIGSNGVNISQKLLNVLKPLANDRIYIRFDKKESSVFAWAPISADYDVRIEMGQKRELLKPVGDLVAGSKGSVNMALKPGTQYWRFVATNKKNPQEISYSSINKLVVIANVPPHLLAPSADSLVTLSSDTKNLEFRWANPARLINLHLDVAKDPGFQTSIFSEEIEDTGQKAITPEDDGDYYWRIIGFQPETNVKIESMAQKFTFKTKYELVPPELKLPATETTLSFDKVATGAVFLVWNPQPGATGYSVHIEEENKKGGFAIDKEVSDTIAKIPQDAKPGQYKWYVVSMDTEGRKSTPSKSRIFKIQDVPKIEWSDNRMQENYFYITSNPSFKVSFKPPAKTGGVGPHHFKVFYRVEGTEKPESMLVPGPVDQILKVSSNGLYHVFIEEFDSKENLMSKSDVRDVVVEPKPLLPAPQFAARMPAAVQASKNGTAPLAWNPVAGARAYLVQLKDESGKVRKEEKFTSDSVVMKNLLPGQYKLTVSSVDEHGRSGPSSEERALKVPEVSDLKPPQFKKFKIH